jgi:hypothetical protein
MGCRFKRGSIIILLLCCTREYCYCLMKRGRSCCAVQYRPCQLGVSVLIGELLVGGNSICKCVRGILILAHQKDTLHCNENPIYVFLFWELRGLSPNFHIHVSVSNLYITTDRSTYFGCSKIDRLILEIYKSLTNILCRNWETEHYNSVLETRRLHSFIFGNS